MTKTNAIRILESKGIAYHMSSYEVTKMNWMQSLSHEK